jgi:antitoxin component YwqK of YwqJK toxin-antitoxin module
MKKLVSFVLILMVFGLLNTNGQSTGNGENKVDSKGNKYGFWTETEGELTWRGEYIDNQKVKTWVAFYKNNYIARLVNYTKGLKDGVLVQIDKKGKVTLMENYRDEKLDGLVIVYGQSSEFPQSETHYLNGKKDGLYRQFYDNGKIQEESNFQDDLKHGFSRWNNKSGQRIAEYNYDKGNFSGIQKTFYENDTLQSTVNYVDNQMSGESKEYYRNGVVKLAGNYLNGLKEGPWTEYNELGKVQRVIRYKAGVEVKK